MKRINWYDQDVIKLGVSLNNRSVSEVLKPRAVSFHGSLLLNHIYSFQLTIHTRAIDFGKGPAGPRTFISFSPSLSWKWVSTSSPLKYLWYYLCSNAATIVERTDVWIKSIRANINAYQRPGRVTGRVYTLTLLTVHTTPLPTHPHCLHFSKREKEWSRVVSTSQQQKYVVECGIVTRRVLRQV